MARWLFLLFVLPLWAQGNQAIILPDDTGTRKRIIQHIQYFASDSLKGRSGGSDSEKKAASYIARYFSESGIAPAGVGDTSYFQRFRITRANPTGECRLIVKDHPLIFRYDFGVTAYSKDGSGKSILVDGQQGIVLPGNNLDQLAPLGNLEGKIVLVELQPPQGIRAAQTGPYLVGARKRLQDVLDRGGVGVIFWNADSRLSDSLFAFNALTPAGGFAFYVNCQTGRWLSRQCGTPVDFKASVVRRITEYINVVGFKNNHASRTIVIGAHYDHIGMDQRGRIYYGADDNASGTAAMMEIARLCTSRQDTGNNYLFIAFGAEEQGLLGSSWFIKHPTLQLNKVRFMLNLDMVGRLGWESNLVEIEATGSAPQWKDIIKATPHPDFKVKTTKASLPMSDHGPFYHAKIPVLFLNTGLHDDYHTLTDTPSSLNYDGIVQIVRYSENLITVAGQTNNLTFQEVSPIHQITAWAGYLFHSLGWIFSFQ